MMTHWYRMPHGYRYELEEGESPPKEEYTYEFQAGYRTLQVHWHSDRPDSYEASLGYTQPLGVFRSLSEAQAACKVAILDIMRKELEEVSNSMPQDGRCVDGLGVVHEAPSSMEDVAKRLRESLKGDTNVQVIGIANQDLVIYTFKKPRSDYPESFEGHKVTTRKIGRIAPLGQVK